MPDVIKSITIVIGSNTDTGEDRKLIFTRDRKGWSKLDPSDEQSVFHAGEIRLINEVNKARSGWQG